MNRYKKLYVLLGVLVVVCGVTFGVCKYEEKQEKIKNSDEVILELATDKVTSLSWENETEDLAFHKDEKWIYDEDEAFPVSEEKIEELLGLFEEFGVSFTIEDVEDYGQYGLDHPECTIEIKTDEETYEIKLGDYSTMDSERYVSIGDGNVYLVQTDPMDYFDTTLRNMIDNDEVPEFDEISHMEFAGTETYSIDYEEDSRDTYCEDDVYFTEQDGEKQPLDTSRVDSYIQSIRDLELSDYVTYNATEEELKEYGLDDPELTVNVQYTSVDDETEEETDGTFVLRISRDPEERKKAEKEAEDITAYVRVGDSPIIYQITTDEYNDLMDASYNALRHQEVLSASFSDITQIDISLENVDYTITSKKKKDERTWYYEEEELDMDDFKTALEALEAEDTDSFTDETPTEKEEISLTVHLDNENYPTVNIQLYRYNGDSCLAVVDGKSVCLVERELVIDLIEAVNGIVL